jgi:heterodisulfide reductase subunit A
LTVGVGAIILALGFKVYESSELEELGHGRYPNVVGAMQYERLASRSGPTEGQISRPSDGRTPRSIAWLQCVGSRDQNNAFCSSICCMYATKEAILAKQRLGNEIGCSVFIMDERAFNKEYSAYFATARQQHGIQYRHCRVSSIQEDASTHDLILRSADPNGELRQERFDMVVLATGLQPPESARDLAKNLGIELNQYGFCETDKFTPLQTTRPGVFVCGAFSSPKEIVETIIDASGAAAEVMRLLNDRLHTYSYSHAWPFLSTDDFPPERDVSQESMRVGVFACSCGDTISQVIDIPAMLLQAGLLPEVVHTEILDYACFPESQDYLKQRIEEANLNRVVVAACSNRTHESVFQRTIRMAGLNPYLLEVVNLREQCAFVHQNNTAWRTAPVRLLRRRRSPNRPTSAQGKHRCLPSARCSRWCGGNDRCPGHRRQWHDVHLVERSEILGGNLRNLYYVAEGYNPSAAAHSINCASASHPDRGI